MVRRAVLSLPEVQSFIDVPSNYLCSGDIHPHPGPSASESLNLKQKISISSSSLAKSTVNYSKSKSHVAIAHLNVRSLICRENVYLVCGTVRNYDYDIFTISETWLNPSTSDADIDIPGYIFLRKDRGERKPGGGVVYVKNTYKATLLKDLSSVSESFFQQLWIKVQCKKLKSFILFTACRPPSTPVNFLECLNINVMDSLLPGLDVILLGDLNCNLLGSCSDDQALLDFCATTNLEQLVKDPTRITETSPSLIDVALTTNENIIYNCKDMSSSISDFDDKVRA